MKIKCRPEDFRVDELATVTCGGGPFALYRLTKQSVGTPEAIDAICRALKNRRAAVSVGGLKDRHAITSQHLTIEAGPRLDWRHQNLQLVYLGQFNRPFESQDIAGNRFAIVIRDLLAEEAQRAQTALDRAARDGVPNYFDDQRFGSLGESGEFIARPWCAGDFQRALWLAIADANEHDTPNIQREKRALRARWGDWPACRQAAETPETRWALEHLQKCPQDFRGAFVKIPHHDRRMYLSAFQSQLWNKILGERLRELVPSALRTDVPIAGTPLPFFRGDLDDHVRKLAGDTLPLPSAREKIADPVLAKLYERVAGGVALEYRELRVKYPRDSFFSRGSRDMTFRPGETFARIEVDDLYAGRQKLAIALTLSRGCYATVVVKQLVLAEPE